MRITAAVVKAAGQPFVIEEIDLDEPRANEVVVRVVSSGICHTDLATRDGDYEVPMPCVLGPFACSVETGAGAIFTSLRCAPGSSLAVFGAGAVGMCAVMAARTR